jgi:uncharacterized protein YndB with AHSA1/START domain
MVRVFVTATETIRAPWERVWAVFSDTSRYPEWVEGTIEVTRTDGLAKLGSTYDEINRAGPIRFTSHWKVIEYEPPRRQVHRDMSLPFTRFFDLVLEMKPARAKETRCTLTLIGESRRGPFGVVVLRLLLPELERQNRRNAARLRALVEREAPPEGSRPKTATDANFDLYPRE